MPVITGLKVGEIEADPLTEVDDEILNDASAVNVADADAEELIDIVAESVEEDDPVDDAEKLPPPPPPSPPIIPDDGVID